MKRKAAIIVLLMSIAALAEFSMGRRPWGIGGRPGVWSGDPNSDRNSQLLFDPYTLTHVTHGVLFYGVLSPIFKGAWAGKRLIAAVALESGWEVLENTDMVIERYRAETISLNYYGDSIVNSISDIFACIFGFALASRIPRRASIIGVIALEGILLFWIRDSLALNIIMLLYPSEAIRMWQMG
jgi:hypothetical protein